MFDPNFAERLRRETFLNHVELHDELGSTNDRGMQIATDVAAVLPVVVVAERQTAGRGRGGNRWSSSDGALTFSIVVEPPASLPKSRWPLLALVAGLAVRDAARAAGAETQLKWPNDVYAHNRKLAGILLESIAGRVVMGVGININNTFETAPADVRGRAISLREAVGRNLSREDLLADFAIALAARLAALDQTGELNRTDWRAACLLSGKRVRIRSGGCEWEGFCGGVDADGALRLQHSRGKLRLYTGEVLSWEPSPSSAESSTPVSDGATASID